MNNMPDNYTECTKEEAAAFNFWMHTKPVNILAKNLYTVLRLAFIAGRNEVKDSYAGQEVKPYKPINPQSIKSFPLVPASDAQIIEQLQLELQITKNTAKYDADNYERQLAELKRQHSKLHSKLDLINGYTNRIIGALSDL